MASTRDIVYNLIGDSKSAVGAFDDVGNAADRQKAKMDGLKTGVTVASAAVVAGVAAFATDSVAAYADAEQSQAQLVAAYEKFPALADVSISSLQGLNTEIQRKTGLDGDALSASQATLAQFGLTGDQIQKLTPLLADYAAKTGKDVNTAAQDLGKAVLGQGKALKAVGVEFSDTGSAAGNFDQLISGLDGTVGGFAETMGSTATGKMAILNENFGDIQETVGQMLIPVLTTLVDVGSAVTAWLADNPTVLQAAAIAVGVLTVAIIAANIAMWALSANPIVLLIMAIVVAVGILIAGVWLLVTNWDAVVKWITQVWSGFVSWITGVINGFVGWWNGIWSAVGQAVSRAWNDWIVAPIRNAWTWIQNAISVGLAVISNVWNSTWNGLGGIVRGIWNGIIGFIENGVNGAIGLINNLIRGVNAVGGAFGVNIGLIPSVHIPRLATGTITSGPMLAMVGDNPGGREVIAPYDSYVAELQRAAAAGARSAGGTSRLHPDDMRALGRELAAAIMPAIKTGSAGMLRTAFGG